MPPTSAEAGYFKGYNPNAKEFYPVMMSNHVAAGLLDDPHSHNSHMQPHHALAHETPAHQPLHHHLGSPLTAQHVLPVPGMISMPDVIKEVWADELESAMEEMSLLVRDGYSFVGMDTEFPGVVAHAPAPLKNGKSASPIWQTIRVNVNILRVIQIGLCFRDAVGNAPPDRVSTFQINFEFDLANDMYAIDSINLLRSSGIDFDSLKHKGCDVARFAELLMSSGLVLSEEITWVSFASGYDFAYLIRLLTSQEVPEEEPAFLELLTVYFPSFYDTKHMARCCDQLQYNGGLEGLSMRLDVPRVGQAHQAGSDSLITSNVFFKLLSNFYSSPHAETSLEAVKNTLFGFGIGAVAASRGSYERGYDMES
ncbi:putative CCR4-associated factor 1-like protein 7 [Diplonema papillatum]|nr:putative CCR4-associated factor 1-like protein 7 [Diplonema papillatum]